MFDERTPVSSHAIRGVALASKQRKTESWAARSRTLGSEGNCFFSKAVSEACIFSLVRLSHGFKGSVRNSETR